MSLPCQLCIKNSFIGICPHRATEDDFEHYFNATCRLQKRVEELEKANYILSENNLDRSFKNVEYKRVARELFVKMESLLNGIEHSTLETLNGKNSREMPNDPDEAFIYGAHVFFKLIGDSYPKATKALSTARPVLFGEGKCIEKPEK